MTSDWLGGGLIVALAAVLWLIYLLPTWFRRNEFLSTERNVVRLQQTLRILAETSEVPDEVHVEANARSVLEQQRILKKANAQNLLAERAGLQTLIEQGMAAQAATALAAEREAALRARALEERVDADPQPHEHQPHGFPTANPETGDYETIVLAPTPTAKAHRRATLKLRRARAATSGILLLALVVAVLGGVQIAINGAWVVLVVGLLAATLCVTRLARLARDGRALQQHGVRGSAAGERGAAGARGSSGVRGTSGVRGAAGVRGARGARDARDARSEEFWSTDELAAAVADEVAFAEREAAAAATGGASSRAASSSAGFAPAAPSRAAGAAPGATGADDSGWTPVPLPKPLYVGNRRIEGGETVAPYIEQTARQAEQALRSAARDSEQALRAAQAAGAPEAGHVSQAGQVAPSAQDAATAPARPAEAAAPAAQPVPSRFAAMGVIDDAATGALDVDRILARRRAG